MIFQGPGAVKVTTHSLFILQGKKKKCVKMNSSTQNEKKSVITYSTTC